MLIKIFLFVIAFIVLENIILQRISYAKNKNINKHLGNVVSDDFIKNRFQETLLWYEKYAFIYRWKFILYSTISLILSSSISIITLGGYTLDLFEIKDNKILVGWISTILSIISGYLYFRSPKERWYNYRKLAEKLKEELSIKYATGQDDKDFLLKIEDHMRNEKNMWSKFNEKPKKKGGE